MAKRHVLIFLIIIVLFIVQVTIYFDTSLARNEDARNITIRYKVKSGDNLSKIAHMFNISLSELMKKNNLKKTTIYPNQVLVIPDNSQSTLSRGQGPRQDFLLLAKAIYAEARGESFTGQVAVGAVILNRVDHEHFPNTIRKVILQRNTNVAEFTPVDNGSINMNPNEKALKAAMEALKGEDPTNGALFFYNPSISTDRWITTLPIITRIGNHVFATAAEL